MFKPNTTVYLCTGTGMDMNNSIWWHRFAYPWQTVKYDDSWWNTCFQFFKAHSISNGFWYCSYIDPARGVMRLGRNPLNNKSIPQGEVTLGRADKQAQMDDTSIPFVECIRAVDYLIFSNGGEGDSDFNGDSQYCFVTGVSQVNWNVVDIHFTVDAIMTYQKFFYLGKCHVIQDMQFQERKDSETGVPNLPNLNLEAPQFDNEMSNFVFQKLVDSEVDEYLSLGSYKNCFVITDIDLSADKIQPNPYWGGIPSFEASEFSRVGETNLGIGVYEVPYRKCNAFNTLGSFNAMEHILSTYLVPSKICKNFPDSGEPVHVPQLESAVADNYNGGKTLNVKVPKSVSDSSYLTGNETDAYTPLNLKMYSAPYTYYSISDRQGNSAELQPQILKEYSGVEADENHYFNVALTVEATLAPNALSGLVVFNYDGFHFSPSAPLLTNWQMPSYSMTPNNSGWNSELVTAQYMTNASEPLSSTGKSGVASTSVCQVAFTSIGALVGALLAPETFGLSVGLGASIGAGVGNVFGALFNPYRQQAEARLGQGTSLENEAIITKAKAEAKRDFGLPCAVGGLPQGYTAVNIKYAAYEFYICHVKLEQYKMYDLFMSVFGYPQNKFRYPHINIRKRWCFVKLGNVNMIPIQANEYEVGGIPTEMRNQIQQRLQAGVTFWNVRHALMGDGDDGISTVQNWADGAIQANKNCKFIRNYGDAPDCDIMKENMSFTGGYAKQYTDDYLYEE